MVEPTTWEKDEATAREIASFLLEQLDSQRHLGRDVERSQRLLVEGLVEFMVDDHAPWNLDFLKLLAVPYVGNDGYRSDWWPEALNR
jgi:hypothetical protein